jgi:hypothetical protein
MEQLKAKVDGGATASPSRRDPQLVIVLIAAIPVLVRLIYAWNYPGADDAFIYLSIVRNVIAGHGWGLLPGVTVNLATSPLFAFLGVGIGLITPHILVGGVILSFAATMLGIYGVYLFSKRLTQDAGARIAVTAAAALNVNLWRWSGTFMEAALAWSAAVFLVFWFWCITQKAERRTVLDNFLLGVGLGVATLLRPELGLFGGVFFLHDLMNDRRDIVRRQLASALGLAVALVPYIVWAVGVYGSPLPTTLGAKSGGHLPVLSPKVALDLFIVIVTSAPAVIAVGIAALGATVYCRQYRGLAAGVRRYAVLFLVPLAGLAFYLIIFEYMQSAARYFLPFTATLPMLLVPFGSRIRSVFASRARLVNRAIAAALAAQGIAAVALFQTVLAPVLRHMWSDYVQTMVAAAARADQLCSPGDGLLVVWDIGVVSNHLKTCRLIDAGALADPDLKGLSLAQMVDVRKPRFVLETLGTDQNKAVTQIGSNYRLVLVWARQFRSHGISTAGEEYTARIFEIAQ